MPALRPTILLPRVTSDAYVCLSCRLKTLPPAPTPTQQRRRCSSKPGRKSRPKPGAEVEKEADRDTDADVEHGSQHVFSTDGMLRLSSLDAALHSAPRAPRIRKTYLDGPRILKLYWEGRKRRVVPYTPSSTLLRKTISKHPRPDFVARPWVVDAQEHLVKQLENVADRHLPADGLDFGVDDALALQHKDRQKPSASLDQNRSAHVRLQYAHTPMTSLTEGSQHVDTERSLSSSKVDAATRQAFLARDRPANQAAAPPWQEILGFRNKANPKVVQPVSAGSKSNASAVAEYAWQRSTTSTLRPAAGAMTRKHICLNHAPTKRRYSANTAMAVDINFETLPAYQLSQQPKEQSFGIRAQLRNWQELHGDEDPTPGELPQDDVTEVNEPVNALTRLPDENIMSRQSQEDEDDQDRFSFFTGAGKDDPGENNGSISHRFLKMGDLVEIPYSMSERESVLAVYVRRFTLGGKEAQFFTMQGRWLHTNEAAVQYSIRGWASPKLIEPLLEHLPSPETTSDWANLQERAYMEDLSVPRALAAPLVKQMLDFYNDSQKVYRQHASALDNAHEILAHDTDLRYGSLASAATALLKITADKLPLTALFTVRKALGNAGFAFNFDARSHRLTGHMQIRSKDQVKMVEQVRQWLRQWQDDLAFTATMNQDQLVRHRPTRGARLVHDFLEKAKAIVVKSRENRQPSSANNVGPSKVRLPITNGEDCVKVEVGFQFNEDDQEIVRFIEAWCCSRMFDGLPRIQSLPPLLVQATGLYDGEELGASVGFMFLQELGTILPYENRVRADKHLLLPSSQHSKPLQKLMASLMEMKDNHNLQDSMAQFRHDWKDLPVYCIDAAGAHEIDDGISIESAGVDSDGMEHHWVHVHIANPTAYFSRDHPLAKMARHMGETIYMPERAYMMLPRWTTQKLFSLGRNRPCLTFSARLDANGNTREHKVTPGIVRNVWRLTNDEVRGLLGKSKEQSLELVLTAGGEPPSPKRRVSRVPEVTEKMKAELELLEQLAAKRVDIRKRAGGVFFDYPEVEVDVWQNARGPGLAWDHPHRKGSRTVEGDPIIRFRTPGLSNVFNASYSAVDSLVRECMLLACEISSAWCAERHIPIIYRGTVHDPTRGDPEQFRKHHIEPATKADGSFPMHIGLDYIRTIGTSTLLTKPKPHAMLGLQSYTKATSPLRRYGDMILHWQIEAALRHEAQTGKSLLAPSGQKTDRSFLPFSAPALETIIVGLQPREVMIRRAKEYAAAFWVNMLLFRKHYFGDDGGLPFRGPGSLADGSNGLAAPLRAYVMSSPDEINSRWLSGVSLVELNITGLLEHPERHGLPPPRRGDVWEVEIEKIDVYKRVTYVKPVRLVGREGAGIL